MPEIDISKFENLGVLDELMRETDHIRGLEAEKGSPVFVKKMEPIQTSEGEVIDWSPYEPEAELQKKGSFESNACVSFSGNNVTEYLANFEMARDPEFKKVLEMLGLVKNGKANFSDRRTAKGSGTDPDKGNYVSAVDDYLRNFFFCPEDTWPFPEGMTRAEFYAALPVEVRDFGKKLNEYLKLWTQYCKNAVVNGITVPYSSPEELWESLQISPVWVSVMIPYQMDGEFIRSEEPMAAIQAGYRPYGHRILVRKGVKGKYYEGHDNYRKQIVKFDWDYPFGSCKIMQFEKKSLAEFIQVGNSIAFLAKGGKLAGKYIGYGDSDEKDGVAGGDVLKAVHGNYSKTKPRTVLDEFPPNYVGKLFIK